MKAWFWKKSFWCHINFIWDMCDNNKRTFVNISLFKVISRLSTAYVPQDFWVFFICLYVFRLLPFAICHCSCIFHKSTSRFITANIAIFAFLFYLQWATRPPNIILALYTILNTFYAWCRFSKPFGWKDFLVCFSLIILNKGKLIQFKTLH